MEQSDFVHDVLVCHNGLTYKAHYCVDCGVLYLKVDNFVWRSPVGLGDIADTARALLTEELLRRDWCLGLTKPESAGH